MEQQKQLMTATVPLPSRGYYYPTDHPLSKGEIEMKYPTAREEDILASRALIKKGTVVDVFLKALIISPQFDYSSLLVGDRNGIMLASRILAYGPEYRVTMTCPNCEEKNRIVINLNEIQSKGIDFDQTEQNTSEFKFKLPTSEQTVTFQLLTQGSADALDEEVKKMKKINFGRSNELTTRLKHIITAVDGETKTGVVRNFVDNMLSRDSLALRDYIRSVTPDIDLSSTHICDSCTAENDISVPLDAGFFWPTNKL